ncbi:MAG: M48 family metalloprotease [Chitinispirillales bacterium]|nr:M48 family metalloprotease [Chitinispirillales bacterium]
MLLLTIAIAPCRADAPEAESAAAGVEEFAEGVHVPSLIAQSKGLERRFLYQNLIVDEKDLTDYLDDVLEKLVTPEEWKEHDFRVRILRSNAFNAFAAPDGTVYVCTGLLSRVESEAQIAAVLAHELAHVVNYHAEKNLLMLKERAWALAKASPKKQRRRDIDALILSDGVAGSVVGDALRLAVAGYVTQLELEADSVAVVRMSAAGYPPTGDFRAFINAIAGIDGGEGKTVDKTNSKMNSVDNAKNRFNAVDKSSSQSNSVDKSESQVYTVDKSKSQVNAKKYSDEDDIEKGYFNVKLGGIILHDAGMNHAAGRFEAVEPLLDKLLAVDSCDVAVLIRRGDMERLLSPRSVAAIDWYERALKCSPNNLSALRAMGFAYHSIGDIGKAREFLRRYCEAAGDAADIKMAREILRRCE